MTIIDGVRAWLKTYEGLADGRLSVDFLPEEAKSYSVDTVPTTEIVKRYLDGSSIRQYLFCVSSREFTAMTSRRTWTIKPSMRAFRPGSRARANADSSLTSVRAARFVQSRSALLHTRLSLTITVRRGISFNSD